MIKYRNLDPSLRNRIDIAGMLGEAYLMTQRNNYSKSKIYYVDGHNGSDTDVGDTPGTALATLEQAITLARARVDWTETPWARQDTIIVFPGEYAENLTALPHGCQIIGLGWDIRDAQFGVKIKPASGSPVDVGGVVNTRFANICFESADTNAAFDSEVTNNCLFEDCMFTGPAETATMAAGFVAMDMTKTSFKRCWFCNADKGMDVNYSDGGDKMAYVELLWCYFTGIDTCGLEISSQLVGPHTMANRCFFMGAGQTMTYGVNDGSALIDVNGCFFDGVTTPTNGVRSVNGSYHANALDT